MVSGGTIKLLQDTMRKDVGIDGDAQRLGQMVWMIFLKVFDDREYEWEAMDAAYASPIPDEYRWRNWAADPEGLTGDDLLAFVNNKLFPALKVVTHDAGGEGRGTVVRAVFEDAYNYMKSGTLLRQVVNTIHSELDFNKAQDRHAFGDLYETLLKGLQSAGDSGEYYTPRPVTEFMVRVTDPQLGEKVFDPACGTGGFLTCGLEHVRRRYVKTADDEQVLQNSIFGVEKKPLPHLLCTTNMILHGIDVPANIRRDNTLARPLRDYGPADRVDVIVTNPPFRGMEEKGVENNFPTAIRTRETADLFLALTLHLLRQGGRAAIVLPDSSLFGEGIKQYLRERLLAECELHTVVRLPYGVFSPYTDIRTNLLFFTKGPSTKTVWFYEVPAPPSGKFTKTKPITQDDLVALDDWWWDREETDQAWEVTVDDLASRDFNLDVENPNEPDAGVRLEQRAAARQTALEQLEALNASVADRLSSAEWTAGARVERLLRMTIDLAQHVTMSAGFVEDLRTAVTELALQGELSGPLPEDPPVAETIDSYKRHARSGPAPKPHRPPPFVIPEHWSWQPLAAICDFGYGRTPPTKEGRYWSAQGEGHPWVSIGDMPRRGVVLQTKRHVSDASYEEIFKFDPPAEGSLLMAFKLSVGKTAILGVSAHHNEAIAAFNIEDEILKRYLLWALPALAHHASANPAVRGSTLNAKSISAMWLPIPPASEQERLTTALEVVVGIIEEIAAVSGVVRSTADHLLKSLGQERALSAVGRGVET